MTFDCCRGWSLPLPPPYYSPEQDGPLELEELSSAGGNVTDDQIIADEADVRAATTSSDPEVLLKQGDMGEQD